MKRILIDVSKCLGCHSCETACAAVHSAAGSLLGAVLGGERPVSRVRLIVTADGRNLPLRCRQCAEPQCVEVCDTGAMQKDVASGVVWCDMDDCVSCMLCADACPIAAITPAGEPKLPLKCDLCRGMEAPACVAACPTGALSLAELDSQRAEEAEKCIEDMLKGVCCNG